MVFDFREKINGQQSFRWIALDRLVPEGMTPPMVKKVAELLRAEYLQKPISDNSGVEEGACYGSAIS